MVCGSEIPLPINTMMLPYCKSTAQGTGYARSFSNDIIRGAISVSTHNINAVDCNCCRSTTNPCEGCMADAFDYAHLKNRSEFLR